jgi:hypothetical protein
MFDLPILPSRAIHRLRLSFPFTLPNRAALSLAACGLALLLSPAASSQTIDFSLNVYYDVPADINSGGVWKLVAKSSHSGIAGVNVGLTGINPTVVNEAPRANVNGSDPAGFSLFDVFDDGILVAQEPAFPGPGQREGAFYGVGTIANGDPGDVGPAFPPGSLTNPQDIPWALGDDLVAGASPWDIAATLLSGTFADNAQPQFATDPTGYVFTSVGTTTTYGPTAIATIINTERRTNAPPSATGADYNGNGFVDAADYAAWRKLPATFGGDPAGYDSWRANFAETVPGASPGSSGGPLGAVPEPTTTFLLLFALICGLSTLRFRRQSPCQA